MTAMLFEHYGLDPHDYTHHVGIDNASSGHGHMAFQAVELFMEKVRKEGGNVQDTFRRIWRGYVAFQTVGTLGADMASMFKKQWPEDGDLSTYYKEEVLKLIKRKAEYGSKNHDEHKLGGQFINSWFSDPEGFLDALSTKTMENGKKFIVPGDLDNSQLFHLISFDGPMSHAFTPEEIWLWKNYIVSLKGEKNDVENLKLSAAIPVRTAHSHPTAARTLRAAVGSSPKPNNNVPISSLLWLNSTREERADHPTGQILGRGTVH